MEEVAMLRPVAVVLGIVGVAVVGVAGFAFYESMGSATTFSALGKSPDIDFAVADCGFANLYDLLQTGYNQAYLGALMPVVGAAYRLRYGYDLHNINPIGALKNNEVSLCLIHGSDGSLIAPSNSEKLRDATKGYVELHLVDDAGYAESRELLGEDAYTEIIPSFLKKALY